MTSAQAPLVKPWASSKMSSSAIPFERRSSVSDLRSRSVDLELAPVQ